MSAATPTRRSTISSRGSRPRPTRPQREALIRDAFVMEKQDIGYIPLHQQPITWAARKGIEMHQGPDNQLRLRLVTVQ